MKLFVCQTCGHVEFNKAPEKCLVCHSKSFSEQPDAVKDATLEGKEKHVPLITVTNACGLAPDVCRDIHVKVGSTLHPMASDHFITWIDAYVDHAFVSRLWLSPTTMQPIWGIHLKNEIKGTLSIIENCNKHGRWLAEATL